MPQSCNYFVWQKGKNVIAWLLKIKIVFKMLPPPETIARPLASLLIPYSHSDIFEYLTWRLYSTCTHIHGYNVILHLSSLGHVMSGSQKRCTKKKKKFKKIVSRAHPAFRFPFVLIIVPLRTFLFSSCCTAHADTHTPIARNVSN